MKNKLTDDEKSSIFWLVMIVLFSICSYLLFSCNNDENNTISISKKEYQALKGDSNALLYPKKFYIGNKSYNIERGSDGHEYYLVLISAGSVGDYRPFHYPDCIKCTKATIQKE
jgi:hypothetical protein